MSPTRTHRRPLALAAALAVAAASLTAAGPALAHGGDHEGHGVASASALHSRPGAGLALAQLRKDLRPYLDVDTALAAGYIPVSECTESPLGGMGVHFLNPGLAGAPVDPDQPAILLYQPTDDGGYRLVGAEWFQADGDQDLATDDDRPTLFGKQFDGPMPGHDAAMPVHYDLHVWLFEANPAGVFAPWNPNLSC